MSKSNNGFAHLSLLVLFWILLAMDKNVQVKFMDRNLLSPDDDFMQIGYIVQIYPRYWYQPPRVFRSRTTATRDYISPKSEANGTHLGMETGGQKFGYCSRYRCWKLFFLLVELSEEEMNDPSTSGTEE
jgi:hypothetical protein